MAVLQGIISTLAQQTDCLTAKNELKEFVRAVYVHDDVRTCPGNTCPKREAVHAQYERLAVRGLDVDELMALMDLVEEMQGHEEVVLQLLQAIDSQFELECPSAA